MASTIERTRWRTRFHPRIRGVLNTMSDLFELHETSICHPFGDEDAAVLIEGGVVRADEFARSEVIARLGAERADFGLRRPTVAEVRHGLVVFVDERDARVKIRNHRELALLIEMAR